jgi:hypothetical protein
MGLSDFADYPTIQFDRQQQARENRLLPTSYLTLDSLPRPLTQKNKIKSINVILIAIQRSQLGSQKSGALKMRYEPFNKFVMLY